MESNDFLIIKRQRHLSLILPRKHHLLETIDASSIALPLIWYRKSLPNITTIMHYPPKTIKTNTLKHIANQIEFIPNKMEMEKNSIGALYNLFSSNIFDVHLLLYYLDAREDRGIIDTLVHLLNTKFNKDVFSYLPQLLSIFLSKNSTQSLHAFFLSNIKSSIIFALKMQWLIDAFYSKVIFKKNQKLLHQLIHLSQKTQIENRREAINIKDEKTFDYKDYRERINEFYDCLMTIDNIKAKTSDENLIETKKAIGQCNKLLSNIQKIGFNNKAMDQNMKNLYKGFILPIDNKRNRIDDQEQIMITNIIEYNVSLCFSQNNNSKSMSYSIPFECIEVNECSLWSEKIIIPLKKDNENEVIASQSDPLESDKQSKIIIDQHTSQKSLCDSLYLKLNPYSKLSEEVNYEIKQKSIYQNFPSYTIMHIILKTKSDCISEMIIMEMIHLFALYFKKADIPLLLTPFQIEVLSESVTLIEQIPNVISLSELAQKIENKMNLNTFFRNFFCNNFEEAQKNLVESLAGYSLVSYLINSQEKMSDNLLLNVSGKVVLKKFGNCFGPTSTNYSMFQLPKDILEIIDGKNSAMFHYFKSLILKGLLEIKKHVDVFIKLVECELKSLRISGFSDKDRKSIIAAITERFHLTYSDVDIVFKIEEMIK